MDQESLYLEKGLALMREEHRRDMQILAANEMDNEVNNDGSTTMDSFPVAMSATHVSLPSWDFIQDITAWQSQTLPDRYIEHLLHLSSSYTASPSSPLSQSVNNSNNRGPGANAVENGKELKRSVCLMKALPSSHSRCHNSQRMGGLGDKSCSNENDICRDGCTLSPTTFQPFSSGIIFHLNRSATATYISTEHQDTVVHHWTKWLPNSNVDGGVQILMASRVEDSVKWHQSMPGGIEYEMN